MTANLALDLSNAGQLLPGRIHSDFRGCRGHLKRMDRVEYIHTYSRPKLVERAEAVRRRNVEAARKSAAAFMEYCFVEESSGMPYEQQWFHDEWHEAFNSHNRVMIIAPRDTAKTSNAVGRTIFELGKDPNLRIKIVSASDSRAKERRSSASRDNRVTATASSHHTMPPRRSARVQLWVGC